MSRRLPLLVLLACALVRAEERTPGQTYFGQRNAIEYIAGGLPIILTAPHGGREKPTDMPDRTAGVTAFDTNTQELARAIDAEFFARTGQHTHLVICRLSRTKVDCNREIKEAAAGNPLAEQAWKDYHSFIVEAEEAVVRDPGYGLLVDLHGHGHKDQRLELGYAHRREDYERDQEEMSEFDFFGAGTLRIVAVKKIFSKNPAKYKGLLDPIDSALLLIEEKCVGYSALLRGPDSLGGLFEKEGFAATPSPLKPIPSEPYFDGGYTIRHHASRESSFGFIDGVQIETNFVGVRDTEASRKKFATATVNVLTAFLEKQMGLVLPKKEPAPAGAK